MTPINRRSLALRTGAFIITAGIVLAACGGSSSKGSATGASNSTAASGASGAAGAARVLPVTTNPITNTSTVPALKIASIVVENNVDPANGKTTGDHIEITLQNTGSATLSKFEVYYTITDPTVKVSESYYTKLSSSFTIPAGGKRVVQFDNTGAPDHYPVNKFGLYSTSKNALEVSATVSATDAAPQTVTIKKDKGGAENAAE